MTEVKDKIEPSAVEDQGGILAIRRGGTRRDLEWHPLQGTGMVDDHLVTCQRYAELCGSRQRK
jgi:hypothetical protein